MEPCFFGPVKDVACYMRTSTGEGVDSIVMGFSAPPNQPLSPHAPPLQTTQLGPDVEVKVERILAHAWSLLARRF